MPPVGILEMPYQRACWRQGVGTEAGTLGGHPGDTPQRGEHPGDAPSGYPGDALSAGMLEIPLGGILEMVTLPSVALCVQGSHSTAPCQRASWRCPSSPGVYGIRLGYEKQHKS